MFKCTKNGEYRKTKNGHVDWVSYYENFEFEFNSRESYLEFRRWWKEEYKELSESIRRYKRELKNTCRKQAQAWKDSGKTHWGPEYFVWKEEGNLRDAKEEARRMMAAIKAAKIEACRQMEEQREAA